MVQTITEWLADVITGKAKPFTCSGYPMSNSHEVVEYELTIGKSMYSYACPKCGFGQGGTLSEEDAKMLFNLKYKGEI